MMSRLEIVVFLKDSNRSVRHEVCWKCGEVIKKPVIHRRGRYEGRFPGCGFGCVNASRARVARGSALVTIPLQILVGGFFQT